MKKIIYIGDIGSSKRTGGGQRFARELFHILNGAEEYSLKNILIQYKKDTGEVKSYAEKYNYQTEIAEIGNYRPGTISTDIELIYKIRKKIQKIDNESLVVTDQPYAFSKYLANKNITMMHGNSSFMIHGVSLMRLRSTLDLKWQKILMKNYIEKSLKLETSTDMLFNSRDTLEKLTATYKILKPINYEKVVYLPVNTNEFRRNEKTREKIRYELGIKSDEKILICVSNFNSKMKNAYLIPKLIVNLVCNKKIKILLVGKGGDKYAEPIENLELNSNVIRVKEVDMTKVVDYYSAADVAFSLSREETFGYTVVEGMACELPTFVLSGGASSEHYDHASKWFICEDVDEMASKIKVSLNTLNIELVGRKMRKYVEKKYSTHAFKNRLLSILDGI